MLRLSSSRGFAPPLAYRLSPALHIAVSVLHVGTVEALLSMGASVRMLHRRDAARDSLSLSYRASLFPLALRLCRARAPK